MDIFQRTEKKYLLNNEQYSNFINQIKDEMVEDEYGWETIYNIYFDDDRFSLINKSLEKPIFKQKLRLRSYITPKLDDMVFFELKKKYKGIVYKRRVTIKYSELLEYLNNGTFNHNSLTFKEIDYFIRSNSLKPKMYIAYDRIALFHKDNRDIRITFDKKIRSREYDFILEDKKNDDIILEDGYYLMEIKVLNAMPIWLSKLLSENKIYPTTYSKYGKTYQKMVAYEREILENEYEDNLEIEKRLVENV